MFSLIADSQVATYTLMERMENQRNDERMKELQAHGKISKMIDDERV
jgi:hypothetical protein